MNYKLSKELTIWIAPLFMVLFVFFVPISTSIKSFLLVMSILAVLATPYYRKYLFFAYNSIWGRAAVVLFLYVVLASFWSEAPYAMRFSVIDKYSKLIYLPFLAVGFINPKARNWALNAYIASMLLTCVLSLLKHYGFLEFNSEDPGQVFYNHIATGVMVALAVYFSGVFYFQSSDMPQWQRAYYLLMIVLGSYQVFFVNTGRTGYVIYSILMSFLILQKIPFKKALLGIMVLAISLSLTYLVSPVMHERSNLLAVEAKILPYDKNTSLGYRMQFHQYARALFMEHPITGIGTGGFKYRYSLAPIAGWGPNLNEPHSQYWLTLAEQGVLGILFLFIFISTLWISAYKLKETKFILFGMVIAFVAGSFTDSILCYSALGSLLILFSALCFGELIEKTVVGNRAGNRGRVE